MKLRWVLIRDPRREFEPQALLSPPLEHPPRQRVAGFVRRWTMAVTFEEARAPLGLEPQRQWNDVAIGRSTPALFGLYAVVTVMALALREPEARVGRTAAW